MTEAMRNLAHSASTGAQWRGAVLTARFGRAVPALVWRPAEHTVCVRCVLRLLH